jgi:hypothetical protein
VCVHKFSIPLSLAILNMAGSDSSVHGGNRGDREPPVSLAELCHVANSLVEAM